MKQRKGKRRGKNLLKKFLHYEKSSWRKIEDLFVFEEGKTSEELFSLHFNRFFLEHFEKKK